MISRETKKYHKKNKEGEIIIETFISNLWFFGIKIDHQDHVYNCDVEEVNGKVGFKADTK